MFNVQAKHPSTPTNLVFNNIIGSGSLIQGDQTVKGHLLISGECVGNVKLDPLSEDTAVIDTSGILRGMLSVKTRL